MTQGETAQVLSLEEQVAALKAGVDIVVACPGRLADLISQGALTLDGVEVTVLDEADHMADLGGCKAGGRETFNQST